MASLIKIKRSEVSGNPAVLGAGELAYSGLADTGSNGGDRLYIGMGTENEGNAVNHVVIGGKYFTDQITNATASNTASTLVKRDGDGNFAAGIITAALTGNASTASKWAISRAISITGDATWTVDLDGSAAATGAITLANSGVTAGSYGSNTAVPVITVDAKGRVTGVTTAGISSALTISDGTVTDIIAVGTDTLAFIGGTGVTTAVTDNTVTISIGQAVNTTSDVTFNNLILDGNLTVKGTTTTVNSTTVAVGDANITLAKDATTPTEANGAGLTVAGASAELTYTSVNDRWNFNKDLVVANVYGSLKGNADTSSKWATSRAISITGDATWTVGLDGSAGATGAITLATVNANTGSFGSGISVPNIIVNEKGLITAVASVAIPTATTTALGLAKFDPTYFSVASGLVAIATIDGGTY